MKRHFSDFARYNSWANARLYSAVFALGESERLRDIGLFFGSLHGTLNHLLLTDRIWLFRLSGKEPEHVPLDKVLFDDGDALIRARLAEDRRLEALIKSYDESAFAGRVVYRNMAGERFEQPLSQILAHLFNHQTHHRGQAHTGLSQLTGKEPPSLDFIAFARGAPAPRIDDPGRVS